MTSPVLSADRGQSLQVPGAATEPGPCPLAVARSATMQLQAPWFSVWLQLRGGTRVDAREGRFELAAGDWIALEPGSHPLLQAGRGALLLGVALPPDLLRETLRARDCLLYPGRGTIASRERLTCSFDMLGEGARTAADAARYAAIYADAISAVGQASEGSGPEHGHGVSVKLSALCPRYEAVQEARVMAELSYHPLRR